MPEVNALDYIDMNLNEVDAWDGASSLIPAGNYELEIAKIEGGQSRAGNPKMVITYKVTEAHEEAEENQAAVDRTVMQSYSLDASNDVTRRRIKALTLAAEVEIDTRGGFNPNDMIGARIFAEARLDTYTETNPTTQERVERNSLRIFRERPAQEAVAPQAAAPPAPEPVPPGNSGRTRGTTSRRGAPRRGRTEAPAR